MPHVVAYDAIACFYMLLGMHAAWLCSDECCCFPASFHTVFWVPTAPIVAAHQVHDVMIAHFAFWHSGFQATVQCAVMLLF